jgi:hypothetical protein
MLWQAPLWLHYIHSESSQAYIRLPTVQIVLLLSQGN